MALSVWRLPWGQNTTWQQCKYTFFIKDIVILLPIFFRLDCIGILKICSYNSKQQRRQRRSTKTLEGSDNYSDISTRICFRAYINEGTQNLRVIKTATEPIRCGNYIYDIMFYINVISYIFRNFSSTIRSSRSSQDFNNEGFGRRRHGNVYNWQKFW